MIEILYFTLFVVILNLFFGFNKSKILACGLVGFSGQGNFSIPIIRMLLWHNSTARKSLDSTGIYTPGMGIIKDTKPAQDFFKLKDKMSLLEENDNILLGHVRHATVGDKSDSSQAHPWDFGSIVMMHNGTLKNHEDLAKKYNIPKENWKVDSQVLGFAIKKNFESNEPFKVLSEYLGAAAVILHHKTRDSLFVYRDDQRTLFYGYLNDTDMYISSEELILEIIGCKDIKSFEPYKVYEIKEGKILSKMKIKTIKAKKNNIIKRIVSSIDSILNYKYYSSNKIHLKGDFTGFSPEIVRSEYLEGYKIKCRINVNGKSESFKTKLTKDKFYKLEKVVDGNIFMVKDDNNVMAKAFVNFFDITNFIPLAGNYVIYEPNTTYSNSPLKEKELYEVIYHKYGTSDVLLRNHTTNEILSTGIVNVRVATDEEVKDYFKPEGDVEIINIVENEEIVNNTESKVEIVEDAEIIEEDEKINVYSEINKGLLTSLLIVGEEINNLRIRKHQLINKEDQEKLNKIVEFISICLKKDPTFILNINENTLKNLTYVN